MLWFIDCKAIQAQKKQTTTHHHTSQWKKNTPTNPLRKQGLFFASNAKTKRKHKPIKPLYLGCRSAIVPSLLSCRRRSAFRNDKRREKKTPEPLLHEAAVCRGESVRAAVKAWERSENPWNASMQCARLRGKASRHHEVWVRSRWSRSVSRVLCKEGFVWC